MHTLLLSGNYTFTEYSLTTGKLSLIKDRGQNDHVLTLTCDLQIQFPVSHDSDSHTCKRSKPKVSQFET